MNAALTFGDWLRRRRRSLDLTQGELARRVGCAEVTLRKLEADELRPSKALAEKLATHLDLPLADQVAFVRFARDDQAASLLLPPVETIPLRASGLTTAPDISLLTTHDAELPAPGVSPFKGLAYFDEADASLFFGREALTARLVSYIHQQRCLAIVGASGSGKSSLVRAGIIPTLRHVAPTWRIHLLTPTAHPLEALAVTLTRTAQSPIGTAQLIDDFSRDSRSLHLLASTSLRADERLLLVVDQFEELFALCEAEHERQTFVDNLMTAIAPQVNDRVHLVLTLRADFYAHCAQYPSLRTAIAHSQEYIGAMDSAELRRAIEAPAQQHGWDFEPGLVDLILRDVGREPGALPLLSHALLATWQRRRGRSLTLAGYAEAGTVQSAIAHTADRVYHAQTPDAQAITRRILLRLTEPGEGQPDTRRRASLHELIPTPSEALAVQQVLETLAEARLITLGQGAVEVAHEALIREWPTLRQWLDASRADLRLARQLAAAVSEWDAVDRDPSFLASGTRLAQFEGLATEGDLTLTREEQAYLQASVAERERLRWVEQERQARELATARRAAVAEKRRAEEQARAARIQRRRAVWLAGALVMAGLLAVTAIFFGQQARVRQAEAETQRQVAFTRELSVNAVSNLTVDPERSILLALHAIRLTSASGGPDLREAEEALHRAVVTSRVRFTLRGHTAGVFGVAYSPDGKRLATASYDKTAKVWDTTNGGELLTLAGHAAEIRTVAFSPDGERLATASFDKTAKVWNSTTGRESFTLEGHSDAVWGVAFSSDGRYLATASQDKTAKVWDAVTGRELLTLTGHTEALRFIAFSPDGMRVATASQDKTTKVWDTATGQELLTLGGHTNGVWGVAYSRDGTRLATTDSLGNTTRLWDPSSGRLLLTLSTSSGSHNSVAFHSTGAYVMVGRGSGTGTVWDVATGQIALELHGHTGAMNDVVFSPEPQTALVATAGGDSTARVWEIGPAGGREWYNLTAHTARLRDIAYSSDGTNLITASADKTVKVWEAATGRELFTLSGHTDEIRGVAISPDRARLATSSDDQTAKVWDMTTGQAILTLSTGADALGQTSHSVAFSPDGQRLAVEGAGNTAHIYDVRTGQVLVTLAGHKRPIRGVNFSPDGSHVATSSDDQTAKVWDAATGREVHTLTGHTNRLYGIAYSRDGRRIATASADGTARLWDAATGQTLLTLIGHTGVVFSAAFNPDDTRLATSSADATIRVWDISPTASPIQQSLTLYNDGGSTFRVIFSPDGRRLAATSRDGARVYALPLEDIVHIAKSRVTRMLTLDECQKFLHLDQCPQAP